MLDHLRYRHLLGRAAGDRGRGGAVAIMVALMLVAIIGFVALGTEVVMLLMISRQMQSAADAGALAAATARSSGYPADYKQEAYALAAAAGFTDGSTPTCPPPPPTPPNPGVYVGAPCDGPHLNDSGYLEVFISQLQPLALAKVVYPGGFIVSGRAIAKIRETPCLITLDTSTSASLSLQGGAMVNLNDCTAFADSAAANAVSIAGAGSLLCADNVSAVGGISGTVNQSPPCPAGGTATTSAAAVANPLANVATPPATGCVSYNGASSRTINPGCYQGNIGVNGGKTLNLCPGVYVINAGNLTVQGSGTLNSVPGSTSGCSDAAAANGVAIVLTGMPAASTGTVTFNGGATINLTGLAVASTSPVLPAGVLFFQDPSAPSGTAKFNGGATQVLGGIMYFPNQAVQFSGGAGTASTCSEIIALTASFGGGTTALTNAHCPTGTPILGTQLAVLVE